jgi:hypothetical protein
MSDEMIFPNLKEKIESLGFKYQGVDGGNVIWGFDGVTKHFPEDVYVRESVDGKPSISLKIKKTLGGITVIINSIPFQERYHLDRAPLNEEEVFEVVERYLKLL